MGGRGVVDADDRRLIADTALPEWLIIARELNRQVLNPLGYALRDRHEHMEVFSENQKDVMDTLSSYVKAFNTDPQMALIIASELGITFSDEGRAALQNYAARNRAAKVTTKHG